MFIKAIDFCVKASELLPGWHGKEDEQNGFCSLD